MATNQFPFFAPHVDGCSKTLSMLELKLLEDLQVELDDPTLWEKMAAVNPGMTPKELEEQFYAVLAEHRAAMLGLQHLPNHLNYPTQYQPIFIQQHAPALAREPSLSNLIASLKQALPDRSTTKGVTWSDEEHRLFLLGMELHGKGDWKSISKYFVLSRTPSQIASHAQKFFNRKMYYNDRRRPSIHDVTSTSHLQNPFGCFHNVFSDGKINYLGQLQMSLLSNRHMPSSSTTQQFGRNIN